jgi:hypothetical protein
MLGFAALNPTYLPDADGVRRSILVRFPQHASALRNTR